MPLLWSLYTLAVYLPAVNVALLLDCSVCVCVCPLSMCIVMLTKGIAFTKSAIFSLSLSLSLVHNWLKSKYHLSAHVPLMVHCTTIATPLLFSWSIVELTKPAYDYYSNHPYTHTHMLTTLYKQNYIISINVTNLGTMAVSLNDLKINSQFAQDHSLTLTRPLTGVASTWALIVHLLS